MLKFFSRIQWKLTLSYALVTVGTVIVLAAMMVAVALFTESMNSTRTWNSFYWSKTAFQDNIPYLLEDPKALQTWLERVQGSGFKFTDFQSYTVRETLDYANTFITDTPIYLLDPELKVITSVPADKTQVGRTFDGRSAYGASMDDALRSAQTGDKFYNQQSVPQGDGSYIVAFPLRKSDVDPVSAIVVYRLKPYTFATPTNLYLYRTFLALMSIIVLTVTVPVGAIFGWLASRGLRKRLVSLSDASKAWSLGDFSVTPRDRSGDEIGELTRNLNRMAEQLQTLLSTRDELTRVEERNRLARDLHDTVKQQTYAARMQLSAAKNLLASNPSAASEHLDSALQLNRETQQELKLIIEELRPAALEGRGLAQAVTEYAARWQEHTGIKTETNITGSRTVHLEVEQTLYRVLQEALSNIARHAQADHVTIALDVDPAKVSLVITDNGCGFDPDSISPSSYGLTSMKTRLEEVGGTLTIETAPGSGTKIIAAV